LSFVERSISCSSLAGFVPQNGPLKKPIGEVLKTTSISGNFTQPNTAAMGWGTRGQSTFFSTFAKYHKAIYRTN
jgi:hypothetical protein